tara:strand:- start:4324 stop:10917 length:6594 start_codon:yes stop_codon:yes gene_type:complete
MATNFNVNPYYDDYDSSKNFHRVLFRPAYSVQARELTQLQTILQNQITKFGNHIFQNGSMVIPGDVNFDLKYDYIKVNSAYNTLEVETYRTSFLNKIITGGTTGVKAKVIGTVAATSSTSTTSADPLTLYIKYEDSGTDNATLKFSASEVVTSLNADNTTAKNPSLSTNQTIELNATIQSTDTPVGTGSAVLVHAGVYFINGHFVSNTEQVILLDKYTNLPSYRIGFNVAESFATPEEDTSLLDNATGSSNVNAPGAHRFKIALTLTKKALTATDDTNFVELGRINGGKIESYKKNADYSELQHTLARRTYDESGNYEVRPFLTEVREHLKDGTNRGIYPLADGGNTNKLVFAVEPGKAYVDGYEIETMTTQFIKADKPRTFDRVEDRTIQTPIGNYVLITNIKGLPDISTFETLQLRDQIMGDTSGNTVIGTARVRFFILHDGSYGSDPTFKLGLFDIKMNDGKDFARDVKSINDHASIGGTGSDFEADIKPTFVAISGVGTGTNSAAGVTGAQSSVFQLQLKAKDRLIAKINGVETDVGRISTFTNNASLTLSANASATFTDATLGRFSSQIFSPNQKLLVFPTNFRRVRKVRGDTVSAPDSALSTSYSVRRKFAAATVSNGTVSFATGSSAELFRNGNNVNDFTLVCTDSSTSSRIGDIINIATSDITLSNNSQTVNIAHSNNGDDLTLIATIDVSGSSAQERIKTLESRTYAVDTQAEAQNTEIKLKHTNSSGVFISDGLRLTSVKMSSDTSFGTAATSSDPDITNRYTFDGGQRDAFYDVARINLKPGQPAPTGRLLITFDHFTHSAGDYFSVDSYSSLDYEDIPSYTSTQGSGRRLELRNCLDFRPTIDNTGSAFVAGSELPKFGTNAEADFSYYLGRRDLVFVDRLGRFDVLQGVPSINPEKPQEPENGMVLFEVSYEPYVVNLKEVTHKKLDNRRYTMRDIGKLNKRISNLEYYTSLNLLEKETADLAVKDSDGLDRLKNGFIVDNFSGHIVGDFMNPDYKNSIDMKKRELRSKAFSDNVGMIESVSSNAARTSSNYKVHDNGIITLPYTELSHIEQPYASDSFDVNPYKVAPFNGHVVLVPYSDDWNDVTRRPDIVVNDDNNFDAIKEIADETGVTGIVWESWQDSWYGSPVSAGTETLGSFQSSSTADVTGGTLTTTTETTQTREVFSQTVGQVRSGIETTLTSTVDSHNMGDRIVGISMIPYMRSRPVSISIQNMKPNARLYGFFDNEDVTSFIKQADTFSLTGTDIELSPNQLETPGAAAATDSGRIWDGNNDAVQAFGYGDIIRNSTHTSTTITGVSFTASNATTANVTLNSVAGISPGHHIQLSGIGGTTQLNFSVSRKNNYVVTAVNTSSKIVTIVAIGGGRLDDGSTGLVSYTSGGNCQRLQASGHVATQGPGTSTARDVFITNILGGFAPGDIVNGTIAKISDGTVNTTMTIASINGAASGTAPTMKTNASNMITNANGQFVGVYYIPNTEEVRFRTGERVLRLIDNLNNKVEIGLYSTKGEQTYYATGIAEEREQTILNIRKAQFQRDYKEETQEVSRTVLGAVQTSTRPIASAFVADPPPPPPPPPQRHDPLAQTFLMEGEEGGFITSVDLWFSYVGTRPVTVQICDTIDGGFPSNKFMTEVTLEADEINASVDASVPTRFTFPSPVYLKDDLYYAILIKVDEPGTRVFFAELGEDNLTDNRTISTNPNSGTLYLSQNGQAWTPHQTRDVKFTLYRADFATSAAGTPTFINTTVPADTLQDNPFQTNTGYSVIRVHQPNHGMVSGDKVKISNVANGFYGADSTSQGIPGDSINGTHTIANADIDTYTISLTVTGNTGNFVGGTSALKSTFSGGTGVTATRNLAADIVQLAVSEIKVPGTNITYSWTGMDTGYNKQIARPITENRSYYPPNRQIVASEVNQDAELGGGRTGNASATLGTSANVSAIMTSTSSYLSPVLDAERISLCLTSNRIDKLEQSTYNSTFDGRTAVTSGTITMTPSTSTMSTSASGTKLEFLTLDIGKYISVSGTTPSNAHSNGTYKVTSISDDGATVGLDPAPPNATNNAGVSIIQHERYLDGIAPTGTSNASNYMTKRFSLANPATALKVLFDANRPSPSTIDIYYKIVEEGDTRDFDKIPYTLATIDSADSPDDNENSFKEREYTINDLNSFSSAAIKIEMKSTNTVQVPRLKNLRVLALAL